MRALFLPQDGESATILFCLWQALFQRFDSGIIFRSQFQGLIQKQSILCVWHMNSLSFSECPICTILLYLQPTNTGLYSVQGGRRRTLR